MKRTLERMGRWIDNPPNWFFVLAGLAAIVLFVWCLFNGAGEALARIG